MLATDIGVAFVVLASIGLVLMLVATLVWFVAAVIKGFARARAEAAQTTRR
ncbi:MAG: hypothetical protein U0841_32080 [Chloroflexia bacterium]